LYPYLVIVRIWCNKKDAYKKKKHKPPSKIKKKRGKNLSPGNKKACHSISTALMQSIAEIGAQSTMKSSIKTLRINSGRTSPKNSEKEHK
jgi:hypothetical protein